MRSVPYTRTVRCSFNPCHVIAMIYSFVRGIIVIEYQRARNRIAQLLTTLDRDCVGGGVTALDLHVSTVPSDRGGRLGWSDDAFQAPWFAYFHLDFPTVWVTADLHLSRRRWNKRNVTKRYYTRAFLIKTIFVCKEIWNNETQVRQEGINTYYNIFNDGLSTLSYCLLWLYHVKRATEKKIWGVFFLKKF